MEDIDYIFDKLAKSKFRSSFYLKDKDIEYINKKGIDAIKLHAIEFVCSRLADITKVTDGKQTPTKGHPVFIAQHATATCCRGCIQKWHKIECSHILTEQEIDYIVSVIMAWINREMDKYKNS